MKTVHLLDYVAGNICSLANAIEKVGYTVEWVRKPEDIQNAEKLILPGVGHFGYCCSRLASAGYTAAIRAHIASGKPFMGICVGLQALFDSSAEDENTAGFGLIPGTLKRFDSDTKSVPHIGWNSAIAMLETETDTFYGLQPDSKYYYVHSYAFPYVPGQLEAAGWAVAACKYGHETFVGAVAKGNVLATQFHPEKSGVAGLRVIKAFLDGTVRTTSSSGPRPSVLDDGLTRRIVACLDVRTNDDGDLVVTKGDQYDVREKAGSGPVRNLGKPVRMAERYYAQGADEVTFLNITSFRNCPLADGPMLAVVRETAKTVFVPLTVGGGIRDTVDPGSGATVSALAIAAMYFASGADKVSIGSDAVDAAEAFVARGRLRDGSSPIEQISAAYGAQAVVVSVDPRRRYVSAQPAEADRPPAGATVVPTAFPGPNDETRCWFQCTVRGGREGRALDVVQLVRAVEALGAGEILLNSIDRDGSNRGFDLELVRLVKGAVRIPVIASSGAGCPDHFREVFEQAGPDAALGAGMFHRGEYTVQEVKDHLAEAGFVTRKFEAEI